MIMPTKTDTERGPPEIAESPGREAWEEYERRKAQLQRRRLPPELYEREIRRITDKLGI